jgi:hypothetical protein
MPEHNASGENAREGEPGKRFWPESRLLGVCSFLDEERIG